MAGATTPNGTGAAGGSRIARVPAVTPGVIATLLLLGLHFAGLPALTQLGYLLFDAYQRAAPRPYEDAPVRIVDIDDTTIAREGQWPWPRTDVARLTKALTDAGASAIGYDIVFAEPDRTSPKRAAEILARNPAAHGDFAAIRALTDHDVLFARQLAASPTVPGFFLTREPNATRPAVKAGMAISGTPPFGHMLSYSGSIVPLTVLSGAATGAGFVSIVGDGDGIVRRAPLLSRLGEQIYPSLSLESLRVAQGAGAIVVKSTDASGEMGGGGKPEDNDVVALKVGQFEVPTSPAGELWMYYTGNHPERVVPAWKIMDGVLSKAEMEWLFAGRIIFIGTGAAGLRDLISTPIRERELGVMVHAQAIEQMVLGRFLVRPDWAPGVESAAILVFGIGLSFALARLGAAYGGLVAALFFGGTFATSWFAFKDHGLLIDPTVPALTVVVAYIGVTLFSFYREERARAYIRNAFDRYLSPELVARIARDPGQLQLGGEERDMTVMFCDIRSFSAISEGLGAQDIIRFLIDFLTPMTDILLEHKATIDKYIGDAILSFWNAPLDDPEQARNAADAGLAMQGSLAALNAAHAPGTAEPWPREVRIGIGLNTGLCCVGNMGSAQRLSYSLIGDTVNLASRIEGLTKQYGVPIAVGGSTAARIADYALIELDQVRVVGRAAPETLFALLGPPAMAGDAAFVAARQAHAAFLALYRAQSWDAAEAALAASPLASLGMAKLAEVYKDRIVAYRASPPGADWDGVYQATEK